MNATMPSRAVFLGACTLALSACNMLMPSPVYTTPRQSDGFRLLSTTRLEVSGLKDPASIRGVVLDGNTTAYNVVLNRYDAGGLVSYRVDEFGNASYYVLPEVYANNLDTAVSDNGAGFLAYNNSGDIDRVNLGVGGSPITIATIQGNAVGPLAMATPKLGGIAATTVPVYRFICFEGGNIRVGSGNALDGSGMGPIAPTFIGAIPTISATFQFLVDSGSGYWGQNFIEFGKFGYSASGGYSWFTARRVDNISGVKEERLVVLPDAGGTPISSDYRPLGAAGNYIIAYEEKRAPSHRVFVLNGSLGTHRILRLVGEDYAYLGERDVLVDALPVPHALFLVMTRQRVDDERTYLYLSLYAYPVGEL